MCAHACVQIGVWQREGAERLHFVRCPRALQHWKRQKEFGVELYLQEALALKSAVAGTFSRLAARNFELRSHQWAGDCL